MPVKRLGILTFTGQRFGVNTVDCAGRAGSLAWHDVRIESRRVGAAVGRAIEILQSDSPPQGGRGVSGVSSMSSEDLSDRN